MELAIRKASAKKAQDRRHILRVAAVTVKAVRHKPFVRAVGVLDAEIEIAVNREAKPHDQTRHADGKTQGFAAVRPMSGHDGIDKCQAKTAAEQRPEGIMLPALGGGCR